MDVCNMARVFRSYRMLQYGDGSEMHHFVFEIYSFIAFIHFCLPKHPHFAQFESYYEDFCGYAQFLNSFGTLDETNPSKIKCLNVVQTIAHTLKL